MNNKNHIYELMARSEQKNGVSIIKTIVVKEWSMLHGARQIDTPQLEASLAREFKV
ncbi:hypothetical protein EDD66_10487 [Mobilisporobacter senegalensis]|uniref:Uncharacterized protein n=1 Tax=Mobilisporobacter senegalensis TaxID=1329262 RepID=A0A3N1XPB9_9FIRM|nr:hypothetical protein [Mobilisporobacter senegalensis]ROR28505.1 hypothetical protein EDD66_10487 [Mobilisporobacter senegalensis]